MKNSANESLAQGFWMSYKSLLHFKKMIIGRAIHCLRLKFS